MPKLMMGGTESKVSLLTLLKVFPPCQADGAYPVVGQFLEGGAGWYPMLGISLCGVIYPVAHGALIPLHGGVDS